jgi:heptosyltransferase-2
MNIAVFMPQWIGDAVMATPALRALRTHFQGARLVGVLRPYVAGVLEGGDWFDEVILSQGGPREQGLFAVARRLRRLLIDLAVLFPNSFRSALVAWLGGCRRRIGYARYGRSLLLTRRLQPLRDRRGRRLPSPVLDTFNRLAECAGCPRPGERMELYTTPRDEEQADRLWRQAGLDACREVVCLNPGGAFGAAKHWPSASFAALARELAGRRGSGVLVLCGPAEREVCREIVTRAGHPAVHGLADVPLSLGLTKACVRRASLLVTTDSGPRHFASAFGVPAVTLFGPTHIAWTDTYHPRALYLQKRVPCGPCQRRICPLDHACMRDLHPAEVYAAACRLLDAPAGTQEHPGRRRSA